MSDSTSCRACPGQAARWPCARRKGSGIRGHERRPVTEIEDRELGLGPGEDGRPQFERLLEPRRATRSSGQRRELLVLRGVMGDVRPGPDHGADRAGQRPGPVSFAATLSNPCSPAADQDLGCEAEQASASSLMTRSRRRQGARPPGRSSARPYQAGRGSRTPRPRRSQAWQLRDLAATSIASAALRHPQRAPGMPSSTRTDSRPWKPTSARCPSSRAAPGQESTRQYPSRPGSRSSSRAIHDAAAASITSLATKRRCAPTVRRRWPGARRQP